jgi:NAD(P)-dependent dehydrogenase (short-subunit alcohol dehydrogenase family)
VEAGVTDGTPSAAGRFDGKGALVTGAASGIGRATAIRFASEGARVVAADVNTSGAAETVAAIEAAGGKAVAVECDVTRLADCEAAVAAAVEHFGRLDTVFANAGIVGIGLVEHTTEADWERVIDVDLHGVFRTAKAALPALRKSGGGAIVFTSSIEGLLGHSLVAAYCTAKTALIGLARALAQEGASAGIRVNCVNPGFIRTPMTAPLRNLPGAEEQILSRIPLGRAGTPEDVAGVVAFLASDDAAYITGQWLAVDGGMTAV